VPHHTAASSTWTVLTAREEDMCECGLQCARAAGLVGLYPGMLAAASMSATPATRDPAQVHIHTAGGEKVYTLHVHSGGSGKGYTLHIHTGWW
jgi:hypothetical protein